MLDTVKNKVFIFRIFIIIVCLIVNVGCGSKSTTSNMLVTSIETIDHSVISDGKEIATIYFQKPVISGNSDVITKINYFFQNQYENWINGTPDKLSEYATKNAMDFFTKSLDKFRKEHKDEKIPENYFRCCVDTEIMYQSDSILSIRQKVYWLLTGPRSFNVFGTTIDLKTGELLPFTNFYDVDADTFRGNLTDFLTTAISSWADADLLASRIVERYGSNNKHNYSYVYNSQNGDLSNDYYYDGNNICMTLNLGGYTGVIVKWNGKINNEFYAEMWSYSNINDIFEECLEYPLATQDSTLV